MASGARCWWREPSAEAIVRVAIQRVGTLANIATRGSQCKFREHVHLTVITSMI